MRGEWAVAGEVAYEEHSDASGLVRVYSAPASRGGTWRRLRFNDRTEQSVVLLDSMAMPVRAALPFGYLKTLAAVGTCTSRALGRPWPPRVLVIGVGGGALPAWFATELGAKVDAVELDDAVLRAAGASMGLPKAAVRAVQGPENCVADATCPDRGSDLLRVYCCDGAAFVAATAASQAESASPLYDVAIVDVFDGEGRTPQVFVGESFARALGSISACAVANLQCPVPMWEDAHEFNAPEAGALASAWRRGFGPMAGVWSVRVPEGQNIVPAVTGVGAAPLEFLEKEAQEVSESGRFAFDPVRRVGFHRREWS